MMVVMTDLLMKIVLDVADPRWEKVLRQAALDADCKSVTEYVRRLIEQSSDIPAAQAKAGIDELPPLGQTWGGVRETKGKTTKMVETGKTIETTKIADLPNSFPLVDDDDMKPARPKVQPMAPRQKTSVFQRNGAVIPPVSGAKK